MRRRILYIAASFSMCVCAAAFGQVSGYLYIDPGHGGPGADSLHNGDGYNQNRGHGGTPGEPYPNDVGSLTPIGDYYEKDVNLQVALELKDTLDAHYWMEDIHYHFTRTTDTALERTERARIANTWGDEESRFVSIHHNSAPTCPTTQRTETLYSALSHCDGCGDDWPWCNVVRNTSDTLAKKLGYRIRDDAFHYTLYTPVDAYATKTVLSRTFMESAITEASYTCDTVEANKFYNNTDFHVDKEAGAIYNGWISTHYGQGYGQVDYEYILKSVSDALEVAIRVGLLGDMCIHGVPYEGCWNESEMITLEALPFPRMTAWHEKRLETTGCIRHKREVV